MSRNILTDRLPETVFVGGMEYPIRWGFRTSLQFEIMMRDRRIPDKIKLRHMVSLYYQDIPPDWNGAIDAALWFYNHGKREQGESEKRRNRKKRNAAGYSFTQDGAYIYASFMEQYGINLQRIGDGELHWWEFMALFEGLNENTQMGKVLYYRGASTSGMSGERRRHINEMKKLYALKDDIGCDMKAALAKRNVGWKDYVRKRMGNK